MEGGDLSAYVGATESGGGGDRAVGGEASGADGDNAATACVGGVAAKWRQTPGRRKAVAVAEAQSVSSPTATTSARLATRVGAEAWREAAWAQTRRWGSGE